MKGTTMGEIFAIMAVTFGWFVLSVGWIVVAGRLTAKGRKEQ